MVNSGNSAPSTNEVSRRMVLLGASNVTRCISTVAETACQVWGRPADVLIAAGYGRSYGKTSRVMARRLPSILACGLWEEFEKRSPLPTSALITDIGNDILYGATVAEIVAWVTECLERLAPRCERLVMTELPVASVAKLDEFRFVIMRSLLFPKSTLQLDDAVAKATELNQAICDLARQFQAKIVATEPTWYGLDPIHVRRKYVRDAWRKIFAAWHDAPSDFIVDSSWNRWWRLRTQRPLVREYFGLMQHTPQPSARMSDGSFVSQF